MIFMEIGDLFNSSQKWIAEFFQRQIYLYRHDIKLQDYFLQLQMDSLKSSHGATDDRRATNSMARLAIHFADRLSQFRKPQKIKADILFCPVPYFERKTENQFLIRTLLGLAETDATILCLMPGHAPCRAEMNARLAAAGRSKQVTFLDPTSPFNAAEARLRPIAARMRGRAAFEETVQVLEPHGLSPSKKFLSGFEHTADFVEAWERISPSMEFDAVVARCHWHSLCSPVCRTGLQRGKPVITFQQGVIGHTLDVPVNASKFVAFGQPSASFLNRANHGFFEAAKMPEPAVDYVNGGCLFDTLTLLPDQFALQTLLLVDVPVEPGDFYGIADQCQALLDMAEKLLSEGSPLRRLIIRPHPYWSNLDLEACQRLVRAYPNRCELSHPAWSLEDDLRRSSIAIGVLSGALTVSSACGLPTIFLQTPGGYTTGDLGCFSPDQTLAPDEAFDQITKLLTDRDAWAGARALALRNGREYYSNADQPDFSGSFFERLLRIGPITSKN